MVSNSNFIIKEIPEFHPLAFERIEWWRAEKRKCVEGYWVSGRYMPGILYFYINFWTILLSKEGSKVKSLGRPFLRDIEWNKAYIFLEARGFSGFELDVVHTCNRLYKPDVRKDNEDLGLIPKDKLIYVEAREYLRRIHTKDLGKAIFDNEARNVVEIGSRGYGKSYWTSCMIGYNFLFDGCYDYDDYFAQMEAKFPYSSETLVGAIDAKYSKDLLNKTQLGIDELPGAIEYNGDLYPSPLAKSYVGSLMAGKYIEAIREVKVGDNWKKKGSRSKIHHRSFGDNPFAGNGTRPGLTLIEEVGFMGNLIPALGALKECTMDGDRKFGTIWMLGTGGDMDGGATQAVQSVFYDPEQHDCLVFEDEWENKGKIGLFYPAYMGLNQFKDKEGVTNIEAAKGSLLKTREKLAKGRSKKPLNDELQNRPLKPSEAFLVTVGNIFPLADLKYRLGELEGNDKFINSDYIGSLSITEEGKVAWKPNPKAKPIYNYPILKDENTEGAILIHEMPYEDDLGNITFGRYLAGCLTPGEKVLTNTGLKNVETITFDDKLINKDGEEVSINTLLRYDKVNEPVFKINMESVDRPTTYTKEHPLYLSNDINDEYEFITAENAKVGMWTKYPNHYNKVKSLNLDLWEKHNQPYTPKIKNPLDNEDFWWFVGHWLGDGFSHSHGKNFNIYNSFGLDEVEYINKYKLIVKNIFNRSPNHKKQNGSGTHTFGSAQLYKFLEENFGKYAESKFIADWVKYIPHNLKLQLVLGYLDSDGSVYIDSQNHTICSFKSVNKTLLNDIQDILFSIGIVSRFNKSSKPGKYNINGKIGNTKQAYSLKINTTELKKFGEKYNSDYNSRKLKIAKEIKLLQTVRKNKSCIISDDNKYIYLKIKSIERDLYTGIVYNFDCETHTFICQYCTTHNCDPYDHDKSETGSLGSCLVYDKLTKRIVAEYSGRPRTANEYYENVRKLLLFFNARLLYENERKGIFQYFEYKNCTYLLADQPTIIHDIVKDSKVDRGKGIHMSKPLKEYGEELIKAWLLENNEDPDKPELLNLNKIRTIPLLKELIAYNETGNFDRVIGLMMVLYLVLEVKKVKVKEQQENIGILSTSFFSQFEKSTKSYRRF